MAFNVNLILFNQQNIKIYLFRVQSNNLGAIAGEDYDAVNELITFQTSDTEKSLFITIRQDAKIENNERFVLILTTDDDGVTIGDNVMTITITDDDGEYDQRLVVTSNSQLCKSPCTILDGENVLYAYLQKVQN